MSCRFSKDCVYYATYRYKSNQRQHKLLVESYCEGTLAPKCRRIIYEEEFGRVPPEDLVPNGYIAGTNKKQKLKNTRLFKRFKVTNAACLLQVLGTPKTFSAWINDISKGGVQFESEIKLEDLGVGQEDYLRVIGHSVESLPFPLISDIVKPVWQGQQVVGCSFVNHSNI